MNRELRKYETLKKKILELDIAIPGNIRKMYQQCGQPSCRCKKSREYWHGPYYLWGRRKNGHLSSKSISKENLKQYKKWIINRKKLKKLVDEMLNTGLEYATGYQDKKTAHNI